MASGSAASRSSSAGGTPRHGVAERDLIDQQVEGEVADDLAGIGHHQPSRCR